MPTDTPNRLVALCCKPLVAQVLGIEIVYLEGAVVHVASLVGAHEECMMVDGFFTAVYVSKDCHVFLLVFRSIDVEEVCGDEVEVAGVELNLARKVLDGKPEMPKLKSVSRENIKGYGSYFMHSCWTWLESLEFSYTRLV